MRREKILKNAVQCRHCHDIIESTYGHDFKYCKCGKVGVDGGKNYLRRLGNINDYSDLSECEITYETTPDEVLKNILKRKP